MFVTGDGNFCFHRLVFLTCFSGRFAYICPNPTKTPSDMKKHLLLMPALAGSLFLTACGGSGTSKMNDDQANKIIEYYNLTIEAFREGYSPDQISRVVDFMNAKANRFAIRPVMSLSDMYDDSATLVAPGNLFGKQAGDSLTMLFRQYYAACKTIDDNFEAFKAYKEAEDYKDDNWAKGVELTQGVEAAAAVIEQIKPQVYAIITPAADAAETYFLADNPLKEHIILSKKIFVQMESILGTVADENVNEQLLDTQYAELEQMVKTGRELPAVDGMDVQMTWYGKFLDEVDAFLGEVRKAKRDSSYTQSALEDMNEEYGDAVTMYNYFVD